MLCVMSEVGVGGHDDGHGFGSRWTRWRWDQSPAECRRDVSAPDFSDDLIEICCTFGISEYEQSQYSKGGGGGS